MKTEKNTLSPKKPQDNLSNEEEIIVKELKKKYDDASEIRFNRIGTKLEEGNMYMVEFKTRMLPKSSSWYYAYVSKKGCELFSRGEEALIYMQVQLEQKNKFLERLRDFDILDLVGALIALPMTAAFIWIMVRSNGSGDAISKEFFAIVSLILGYYFGRNKSK